MWQKKEGKFHFSSSDPLFRRGPYNFAKTGWGTKGLPQGCPGDAPFPGVIHLVQLSKKSWGSSMFSIEWSSWYSPIR